MESITAVNQVSQQISPPIDYDGLMRWADEARYALQAMRSVVLLQQWRAFDGEAALIIRAADHIKDALVLLTLAVKRLTDAADTRGIILGAEEENDITF